MIHILSSLVQYLDENTIDESHALKKDFVVPLRNILEDFNKLKAMLEECIDIGKAKQNDYIINPDFSPELKVLDE
jgi:DNA mismatch repair protein MSH2